MLYSVVLIQGPFFACSSEAINASNAPTTSAELGSSGAFAAKGSFQKLVGAKKRNGAAGSAGATGSTGATGSLTGVGSLWVVDPPGDEPEPPGGSDEAGAEPDRFGETLGLVRLVFDLLAAHDLPAFRCLPALRRLSPRAAATHFVGRVDDDFLLLARRSEAREEATACPGAREADGLERCALALRLDMAAIDSIALVNSRQIRIAIRRRVHDMGHPCLWRSPNTTLRSRGSTKWLSEGSPPA
jgi:hypothetical protein